MTEDGEGGGGYTGGGGVLILVFGELALDPKIDVSHRFHSQVEGTH